MRPDLPPDVRKYGETPEFDGKSAPEALRRAHRTRPGVWGRLTVRSGALDYVLPGPPRRSRPVVAGESAIIEPEVEHHVAIDGPVTFRIEFYR